MKLPVKLSITIQNLDTKVSNSYNKEIILKIYEYWKSIDTSENYQNGVITGNYTLFWIFWFNRIWFYKIAKKEEILKFLDSKRKSKTEDPK